jgi:hypothetical protein
MEIFGALLTTVFALLEQFHPDWRHKATELR